MNYRKLFAMSIVSIGLLSACSEEEDATPTADVDKPNAETVKNDQPAKQIVKPDDGGTVEEDGYLKYRSAEWSGEQDGVAIKVNSVSFTEDLSAAFPVFADSVGGIPAAFVWVSFENTGDQTRSMDFIDSSIVLDSGHEYKSDTLLSEFVDEEIRPGSIKDGDITFPLPEGTDIRAIKSLKLYFKVGDGDYTYTEVEAPIQLQ